MFHSNRCALHYFIMICHLIVIRIIYLPLILFFGSSTFSSMALIAVYCAGFTSGSASP